MSTIWRHPALSEYASVEPIEDDALLLSPDFVSCLPSAGLIASAYASFTPDAESLGWLDGACGGARFGVHGAGVGTVLV